MISKNPKLLDTCCYVPPTTFLLLLHRPRSINLFVLPSSIYQSMIFENQKSFNTCCYALPIASFPPTASSPHTSLEIWLGAPPIRGTKSMFQIWFFLNPYFFLDMWSFHHWIHIFIPTSWFLWQFGYSEVDWKSLVCILCWLVNLIMVFICIMLWNNYIIIAWEITNDSSMCQRVVEVSWETVEGSSEKTEGNILMWECAQ